jgi:hypothetical protein
MAGPFRAKLTQLRDDGAAVRLTAFGLQEGYSTGWSGTGVVVAGRNKRPLNPGGMMSAVMASGVIAGLPMTLELEVDGGQLDGVRIRTWPSVVTALRPYPVDETSSACDIHLMDPVSYLAERPVWGAFRSVSAAEAVGGALSLAAGGDGKPETSPILNGLPLIEVVAEYRDALAKVPYVIAAGQRLGDWLADFLAMLGLRAELFGRDDGRLQMTLTDGMPRRQPLPMSVVTSDGADPAEPDNVGTIAIQGHSAFPGAPLRGAMLDDPAKGAARPLVATGPVGALLTEAELDVDEATRRVYQAAQGRFAEMFMLTAMSRQPRIRPGETVRLSRRTHGLRRWQVSSATHWLRGGVYDNDATLIRGDLAWHPELPPYRPPVYVSAVVDGSNDHDFHQPVARDRLGRIKVVFPFTPTPTGQEALEHAVADTDGDGRVTLDDFNETQVADFTDNSERWEEEKAKYEAGDYNDPFPGREDSDLTEDEQAQRSELLEKRKSALSYSAYKRASERDARDRDRDGTVSARDDLVSDPLAEALRDDTRRAALEDAWEDRETNPLAEDSLASEYGDLLGDDTDGTSAEAKAAREDAAEAADRWPPRIPLPVVMPMAGALHGFITAHRHGDTCRVAVHNPMHAEIVGFQYRDDRKINQDLSGAVAGLVVEHNYAQAWSGLVFRRADDLQNAPETREQKTNEEADADDSDGDAEPSTRPGAFNAPTGD